MRRPERLGTVHFATSCRADVQPAFDRAVALLHSFWFTQAREAFTGVLEKDPGCAIADWGIALTYFGNPFGVNRSAEAIGRRARARSRRGSPPTRRPRASASTSRPPRSCSRTSRRRTSARGRSRTSRPWRRVAKAYPDDTEATIFYALALAQNAPPTDKTYKNLLAAGALLEPLFAKQPDHPGLAHYIIHAYDVPAARAEGARRRAALRRNRPLGAARAPHAVAHVHARRCLGRVDRRPTSGRPKPRTASTP